MCGIAAILSWDRTPKDADAILRMTDALVHRGPDDSGFVFIGSDGEASDHAVRKRKAPASSQASLAMGFRRLSIIDLSPLGHQPMCNEDRTLWLVFNGEIYNYLELRAILRKRGHIFRSQSDSEVILHAYEEWGAGCVKEFNGMWAFALWDGRRQSLFCSRDRFGVKPLYYSWDGRTFCLASEPKAIVRSGLIKVLPNYRYLLHFLADGVLQDGEEIFYEGIRSILPGHSVIANAGGVRHFRYWDYQNPSVFERYDFSHPEEMFRELLTDAVRIRLRSDVAVGSCLSGGLDSSAIVAIATHLQGKGSLDTFSATFNSARNDESAYMRLMSDTCETRNSAVWVDGSDLFAVLPRIIWHLDGPCLSASTYPFWKVAKLARQRVKVLLDGQGADELLGGYLGFFPAHLVSLYRSSLQSRSFSGLFGTAAELLKIVQFAGWRQLYFLYRDYSYLGRTLKPHRRLLRTEKLINSDLRGAIDTRSAQRPEPVPHRFENELTNSLYKSHSQTGLPGLLQYGDAISMAHSLEARLPFMDYRLVEYCFALPPDEKIRGTTTKWLLRRSLRGIVPDAILDRKDKVGFATPFASWICGPLREPLIDVFDSRRAREHGVFNVQVLKKVLDRHIKGRLDMSYYIWRWLTTELWLSQLDEIRAVPEVSPGTLVFPATQVAQCVSQ